MAERELGYDDLGRIVHRWPGGESFASHGILDLAVFDASAKPDLSSAEFETLWRKAIEEEEFFGDKDPDGERFATRASWWGCLAALAAVAAVAYVFVL